MSLMQAQQLLGLLDDHGQDFTSCSLAFDQWCTNKIKPWFTDHVYWDSHLLRRWSGEDVNLSQPLPSDLICAAAEVVPELRKVTGRYQAMMTLPASLGAAEPMARDAYARGWRPPIPGGPNHADLTEIIRRACIPELRPASVQPSLQPYQPFRRLTMPTLPALPVPNSDKPYYHGVKVMVADFPSGDLLGDAALSDAELRSVVSSVVGHPAAVADWHAEAVPYQSGSPATGALARVRGVTLDGQPWSVFVKVLQHPRHWRLLDQVPDEARDDFLANIPWRAELGAWEPSFAGRLPAGLRVPLLYRVVELPGDRVALWMEDIAVSNEAWTADRFEMAARSLGTLAANRRDPELIAASPVPPGYGLRRYFHGVVHPALPSLRSHDLWGHPGVVGGGPGLRAEGQESALTELPVAAIDLGPA